MIYQFTGPHWILKVSVAEEIIEGDQWSLWRKKKEIAKGEGWRVASTLISAEGSMWMKRCPKLGGFIWLENHCSPILSGQAIVKEVRNCESGGWHVYFDSYGRFEVKQGGVLWRFTSTRSGPASLRSGGGGRNRATSSRTRRTSC
jgi:hypothetical protein